MYDALIETGDTKTMGEVAKMLGIGRNKMMLWLRSIKILDTHNIPYQNR